MRAITRLFVLIAVNFTSLSGLAAESSAAELAGSRPNIVLVITDDQGYGPVGKHGHPWIETPNLDAMYERSVRFERFLVSPTCAPTRSALMTGRHPMRNGITHTIFERERMTLDATILPQVLKSASYTTGIFGKWHLGDEEAYQPHNRGFDEAFIHGAGGIGQAYDGSCADVPGNKYFDPVIRHNGKFVKTDGYCTDLFFEAALVWISQVKEADEPFFAYITTNAPHSPFIAPEKNHQRFTDRGFPKDPAGFYGMVENIDENMGLLFDKLAQWQLLDNTVVIFMSDNGMSGGTGQKGKALGTQSDGTPMKMFNAGMRGTKGSAEEGGVRVPLFVRWDGQLPAGRDVHAVTAHIDLLPTLAELAGAQAPSEQVEGRSLLPWMTGCDHQWPDRYLFTHVGRWPNGANVDEFKFRGCAVRNNRFRFVDNRRLYDMRNDPSQITDVIDEYPQVVAEMRSAYDQWWEATKPMMANEGVPLSPTKPFHVRYEKQRSESGIPDWQPPAL